ncbi:MAG: 16S rRNA (cytidine(1402)-2'-O)-methyltransferase [Pseudomonadales bacterium]
MTDHSGAGILYVVATPIGNLEDLTFRAADVLKSVQIIAAEDTRRTAVLLAHIGHRAPELKSLHEHNETAVAPELLQRLRRGDDVALVSDAGTPQVNDPGFNLVSSAYAAGLTIVPLPGASALTTLLSVSPLPSQPFQFVGFLASKAGARAAQLDLMLASTSATVFLESPKRVRATLKYLAEKNIVRPIVIGRELTKKFESIYVGSAAQLLAQLDDEPRGEFICLLSADSQVQGSLDEHHVLCALLKELPPAQAARLGAAICGARKSAMYDLALQLGQV